MTSPKQKIIMHQNYETETMLMYLQHPVGMKTFLCKKFLLCQEICQTADHVKVIKKQINFFPDLANDFSVRKDFFQIFVSF